MATAPSPKGKTEPKPAEPKPEPKEVEENPEPLKYKTWVLKVSIHCEACKRKVKKILTNIEGVYTTDVDLKQQKVTVIGNVDSETLIKKLERKTGKHVELWPEKTDQKQKKQGKGKNKEKQSNPESSGEEAAHGGEEEKETGKIEVPANQEPPKSSGENGNSTTGGDVVKVSDGGATSKVGVQFKEVKPEVKQDVTSPAGSQPPVSESEGGAEKSGSGSGGKKKKKKGHKGNSANNAVEGEHSSDAPPGTGSLPGNTQVQHVHATVPSPANHSPPHQHFHDQPFYYHAPPVHAVSYNTTYPSSSYAASYYAAPSPYSYAYMHPGPVVEPPPPDYHRYDRYPYPPSQSSDSFELFSDENPNACSIM